MNNLKKIQRVSAFMQGFCLLLMVSLPVMLVGFWMNLDQLVPALAQQTGLPIRAQSLQPTTLGLGFACMAVPMAVLLYGIWRLYCLFGLYRQAQFFTRANAHHLLVFATTLFINVLLAPVVSGLLSVILTWHNPPGQKALSIGLGSQHLAALFVASAFMVIAWIMLEGKKLADENAEII